MRRLIALLIIFNSLVASAQSGHIKVSLRNGTTIEGEVKEFDALDHITIIVGSLETTIPMSEVAYVSNVVEKCPKCGFEYILIDIENGTDIPIIIKAIQAR